MYRLMMPIELISIHAPHTGGDFSSPSTMWFSDIFQSTPPIRGATQLVSVCRKCHEISIHAPHTGGDFAASFTASPKTNFNPRPPYGGRPDQHGVHGGARAFQSTPPIRGATAVLKYVAAWKAISIHAPHTGGDTVQLYSTWRTPYFNPRPPYGGRRQRYFQIFATQEFQSTPPIRGATEHSPV